MTVKAIFRPVAEHGLLVDLGDRPGRAVHDRVLALDHALAAAPFPGFVEAVPGHVNLLVRFDPLVTDHRAAEAAVARLLARSAGPRPPGRLHEVGICCEGDLAPDMAEVARRTGLTPDRVVALLAGAEHEVAIYGFAPGYAYLTGLPEPLHLPRKPAALRDVPAGSLLVAAGQCIVSTLTMPTGWWILGRSPVPILTGDPVRPFRFDVGDRVRFRPMSRAEYEAVP